MLHLYLTILQPPESARVTLGSCCLLPIIGDRRSQVRMPQASQKEFRLNSGSLKPEFSQFAGFKLLELNMREQDTHIYPFQNSAKTKKHEHLYEIICGLRPWDKKQVITLYHKLCNFNSIVK